MVPFWYPGTKIVDFGGSRQGRGNQPLGPDGLACGGILLSWHQLGCLAGVLAPWHLASGHQLGRSAAVLGLETGTFGCLDARHANFNGFGVPKYRYFGGFALVKTTLL